MRFIATIFSLVLLCSSANAQALLKGSAEADLAAERYHARGAQKQRDRENAKRPETVATVPLPEEAKSKAVQYMHQVENGAEPKLSLTLPPRVGDAGYYGELVTVRQVIDERNFIGHGPLGGASNNIGWYRGWSTEGIADGGKVVLEGFVAPTKTTTYNTIAGASMTVFVIEPVDQKSVEDAGRDWRDWTSADGNHTLHAAMTGFAGGKVQLLTKEGRELSVVSSSLSRDDQTYIRQWVSAKREAQRKKR